MVFSNKPSNKPSTIYAEGENTMAKRGENIYLRKDGRYEGRYVIGKKSNGRTAFGYVYGRKYTDVKRKLELMKAGSSVNHTMETAWVGDGSVEVWLRIWLEEILKPEIKASSYAVYRGMVENHMIPAVGKATLCKVNADTIQYLYDMIRSKKVCQGTAQNICKRFRAALTAAYEAHFLTDVPKLPFKKTKKTQNSPEFLSISAQEKLEGQLDPRHNIKDFAVLFSLYTGVRIGECCAVKWKNIHFEDSELLITHTLQRVRTYSGNSKTCLQYSEPKSQCAVRRIPLTGTLMELLKGMRQSVHGTAEEFVFRSHAHVLEPRALQHHIKKLAEACGIANLHFHTLRHSFATRCLENHIDIKTLAELMGHSTAKFTLDWYGHSTSQQKRKYIDRLERLTA